MYIVDLKNDELWGKKEIKFDALWDGFCALFPPNNITLWALTNDCEIQL